MSATDHELLENFLKTGDNAPFAELVRRHLGLVYSAAIRITNQPSLADEVCQLVFIKLARVRSAMRAGLLLVTWLHRTTRSTAIDLVRAESRRRNREQIATSLAMNDTSTLWQEISPVLDDVIDRLPPDERHLVLSRFFEGQSHAELGHALGLSEDAVRMRMNRSLAKIRALLQKRGITTTAAALSAALPAHGMVAVPSGLASSVVSTAVAAFTPSIPILTYAITLMTKKTAVTAAAVLLVAGVGTAVYTASHSKDAPSSGGAAGSQSQLATGVPAGMDSPAPARSKFHERQAAKDKPDPYGDLVSTYGESRVKLAKHITASIIGILGVDGVECLVAEMVKQTNKETLNDLGKKFALNDSQKQQVQEICQKFQARQNEQLTRRSEHLKTHSKTFNEVLLAGDAYKRNKISKQEYDAIASKFDWGIMDASTDLGPLNVERLMEQPEFVNALKPVLDSSQLQLLEKEIPNTLADSKEEDTSDLTVQADPTVQAGFDLSFKQPETLESLDTKATAMANTIKGIKAVFEGLRSLQESE